MNIHKTGPLDRNEFLQLQELLRRFVSCHDFRGWKTEVYATQGLLRSEYDNLFTPKVEVPMTAGPDPIPVHELLNGKSDAELTAEILSYLPGEA